MTEVELLEIIAVNTLEIDWSSDEDIREFAAWLTEKINKYGPRFLPHMVWPEDEEVLEEQEV